MENPELDIIFPTLTPQSLDTIQAAETNDRYVPEAAIDTMSFANAISTRWQVFSDHYERTEMANARVAMDLSLIHISEPTRLLSISYAVFCLKKKMPSSA